MRYILHQIRAGEGLFLHLKGGKCGLSSLLRFKGMGPQNLKVKMFQHLQAYRIVIKTAACISFSLMEMNEVGNTLLWWSCGLDSYQADLWLIKSGLLSSSCFPPQPLTYSLLSRLLLKSTPPVARQARHSVPLYLHLKELTYLCSPALLCRRTRRHTHRHCTHRVMTAHTVDDDPTLPSPKPTSAGDGIVDRSGEHYGVEPACPWQSGT